MALGTRDAAMGPVAVQTALHRWHLVAPAHGEAAVRIGPKIDADRRRRHGKVTRSRARGPRLRSPNARI
jgi:hypothetical protein